MDREWVLVKVIWLQLEFFGVEAGVFGVYAHMCLCVHEYMCVYIIYRLDCEVLHFVHTYSNFAWCMYHALPIELHDPLLDCATYSMYVYIYIW